MRGSEDNPNLSSAKRLMLAANRQYPKDVVPHYWLAVMHWKGLGYPANPKKAEKTFRTFHSLQFLTEAIRRGRGLSSGAQLASGQLELYQRSAFYNLAIMYLGGNGIPTDKVKARFFMRKAAILGHLNAQYYYGIWWYEGFGGKNPDQVHAYAWLRFAASRGHKKAKSFFDPLYDRMKANEWQRGNVLLINTKKDIHRRFLNRRRSQIRAGCKGFNPLLTKPTKSLGTQEVWKFNEFWPPCPALF